jgi:hypothetical protein
LYPGDSEALSRTRKRRESDGGGASVRERAPKNVANANSPRRAENPAPIVLFSPKSADVTERKSISPHAGVAN